MIFLKLIVSDNTRLLHSFRTQDPLFTNGVKEERVPLLLFHEYIFPIVTLGFKAANVLQPEDIYSRIELKVG